MLVMNEQIASWAGTMQNAIGAFVQGEQFDSIALETNRKMIFFFFRNPISAI